MKGQGVAVPEQTSPRAPFSSSSWWLFCFLLLLLKCLLLGLDANPKMFMGDSGSYLWTALSGWIPPDRSFVYGFLIRWVAISTHSLTSLLILQTLIGTGTALLVTYTCLRIFEFSPRLSYLTGFLCAIDPLQLVWERYLMTETISLFCYAAMLFFSFTYLKERRLWQLAALQVLAILLISFRVSYLLVVQASTVALPIIAFFPGLRTARTIKILALHLLVSLALMFAFHSAYKQLNGRLSGRAPAYLYSSGFSILATWAPVLQPADSADPRLGQIIADGAQFQLANPRSRNNQLYSKDSLISRWKNTEPDLTRADAIAKQTALRALVHHPVAIYMLGVGTFLDYFDWNRTRNQARYDLGLASWPTPMTATMADRFRLAPPTRAEVKSPTILQRYLLDAHPYYFVALSAPLLCAILFWFRRHGDVLLIFLHGCILLATDSFLAVTASVRYLQPLSLLALLALAFFAQHLISLRLPPHPAVLS